MKRKYEYQFMCRHPMIRWNSMRFAAGLAMGLLFAAGIVVAQQTSPQPPAASSAQPALQIREVAPESVGFSTASYPPDRQGAHFDPKKHIDIYKNWSFLEKEYWNELRRAVLNQDAWNFYKSKAHFDNCNFSGGHAYIQELLLEVDKQANIAQNASTWRSRDERKNAMRKAYFALGQIMHGVQDFYSHTNYVELRIKKYGAPEERSGDFYMDPLNLWEIKAADELKILQVEGLVSGVFLGSLPYGCEAGTQSHHDLAKDSPVRNGAVVVSRGEFRTLHEVSLHMATQASLRLIEFSWVKWPVLDMAHGKKGTIPLDVFIDRRHGTTP